MIFVTAKVMYNANPEPQLTFEDLLQNINAPLPIPTTQEQLPYAKTVTYKVTKNSETYRRLLEKYPVQPKQVMIANLWNGNTDLIGRDTSELYRTFYIPKSSGGMRRIDTPEEPLMSRLTEIKNTFETTFLTLPHNCAHAYTAHRSTVTAMKLHQKNNSKWFLKLDMKDFFPSHNLEYIMNTLSQIHPFAPLMDMPIVKAQLKSLLKLGLLNDSLPQGTPLSPFLTNTLMIPYDYAITVMLNTIPNTRFVYTRYADDLLISSGIKFSRTEIEEKIAQILEPAPFNINPEKTRFGSSAGRNWNLGIMLNKDNKLTIGHKQNQRFRAMVFSFLKDLTNNVHWDSMDIMVMLGQISYYEVIQPEYVRTVLNNYADKFNIRDFKTLAKQEMNRTI